MKPRVTSFEKLSTKYGGTARVPVFADAPSHSRSSSRISGRSLEAAPVRCRLARKASSSSSATNCFHLSSLSRRAFGSLVSQCLRLPRRRPRLIGNSACRFRLGLGYVLREVPLPAFANRTREHGRRYSKRLQGRPSV